MGDTPRERLRDAFASPGRKRRYNRRLFTAVAPRYDLITRLLSYGRDQHWKDALVRLAPLGPGSRALDIACGTGDLALRLDRAGARVAALDLTPAMLALAREREADRRVHFVAGDMGDLPFADGQFDLVTAGYALRNLPDLDQGLSEIARVLTAGGRLLSLDFDRPASRVVREAYLAYLWIVGSVVGLALHGDPDTYRYIAASLRRYPGAPAVARRLEAAGFVRVSWQPVFGGLMAFHVAERGTDARSHPASRLAVENLPPS
jgi:demethylmenaquinone methyltransferase/2-methoxy-6-polyprenyl-1,4-benzoquinol methylase